MEPVGWWQPLGYCQNSTPSSSTSGSSCPFCAANAVTAGPPGSCCCLWATRCTRWSLHVCVFCHSCFSFSGECPLAMSRLLKHATLTTALRIFFLGAGVMWRTQYPLGNWASQLTRWCRSSLSLPAWSLLSPRSLPSTPRLPTTRCWVWRWCGCSSSDGLCIGAP